ncbi:MAG TPA: hypothetical protein VF789_30520 [Thermoanaerobaculia bacterium]
MPRARAGILMLFLACALLGGCVRYRSIADSAVSFNMAIEKAQNEMLLLNAVRSAKRRPMYITGVSNVTGSVRVEVSAGLDVPVSDRVDRVSPRASYSESPAFSVPVLDTQEFIQGFLKPVPNNILAYYWEQGWPRSLLIHLFVQRARVRVEETVEVEGKRQSRITVYTLDNYPNAKDSSLCKFVKFSRFVDRYLDPEQSNPRFEVRTSTRNVGPPLSREQVGSLEQVLTANRDRLEVVQEDEQFRIRQQQTDLALVADRLDEIADFARLLSQEKCDDEVRPKADVQVTYRDLPGEEKKDETETVSLELEAAQLKTYTPPVSAQGTVPARPTVSVEFFIRSPEGILYYLGQLMRVEEELGVMPEVCIQGNLQPIFNAVGGAAGCGQGIVSVRYDGERYVIPREAGEDSKCEPGADAKRRFSPVSCVAGRSMQSLSLLNQLIALQKSAKDLPSTGLIRTVGQ